MLSFLGGFTKISQNLTFEFSSVHVLHARFDEFDSKELKYRNIRHLRLRHLFQSEGLKSSIFPRINLKSSPETNLLKIVAHN